MANFNYIKPTEAQLETMQFFREQYQLLSEKLNQLEDGRGLSLAITKLEESAFWLNKHITNNA